MTHAGSSSRWHGTSFAAAASLTGIAAQGASRFAISALVGRWGGPVALGLVAAALSTAQVLTLLGPSGAGSAASRFTARARGRGGTTEPEVVQAHLARRTLQAVPILSLCVFPSWIFWVRGDIWGAIAVVALTASLCGYVFVKGVLLGQGLVIRAAAADLALASVGTVGAVGLLILGHRGIELIVPMALANLSFAAIEWPRRQGFRVIDRHERREIDVFIGLATLGTIASAGFLHLSLLAAQRAGGLGGAGHYAAAVALATPIALVSTSLSMVLFPMMSEAWGREDSKTVWTQTDRATRLLAFVMVAIALPTVICAETVVTGIWGDEFVASVTLVQLLLVAITLGSLATAATSSVTSKSNRGMALSVGLSGSGFLIGAVIWVVSISVDSLVGVAGGYALGSATTSLCMLAIVWRTNSFRWFALATRIAGATAFALLYLFAFRQHPIGPVGQMVVAAAFLGTWLLICRTDLRIMVTLVSGAVRR